MNEMLERLRAREKDPTHFTQTAWAIIFDALLQKRDPHFGTLEDATRVFARYTNRTVREEMRKGYLDLRERLEKEPKRSGDLLRLIAFAQKLRLVEPEEKMQKRRSR